MIPSAARPTRIEVDLAAVRTNVARLAEVAGVAVCAVVKADGYGHGAVEVARAALEAGAGWLAVATIDEGAALRAAGIEAPILLLVEPPVATIGELLAAELTPMVYRAPFLAAIDAAGQGGRRPLPVHLKADTGMARAGIAPDDWEERLKQAAVARGIEVQGLATHLARADEPEVPTTDQQLDAFERFLALAARLGVRPALTHAANTAGALVHPRSRHTLVRVGIGVYGLSPDHAVDAGSHGLVPALRFVTEVALAKRIAAGTPVSYGHRWRAPADGWLATLPVGYADGVPRALTNVGEVLVGGRRCAIAGTVCMDQITVWCGDVEPEVGDEVVLIGAQGDERVRVEEWARHTGTITYEIATGLSARTPRHYRVPRGDRGPGAGQ